MTDFEHAVLFYGGEEEFLAGTVPYLQAAVEAGEPALVAVGPQRTAALKAALGDAAAEVSFAEMRVMGRNPARIIPFWRDVVEDRGDEGPVRGIGEPIWPGRTSDELDECRRHECLLNVAFADLPPWTLVCPYDTSRLDDAVLEEAARCHPFVSGVAGHGPNVVWGEEDPAFGIFSGALPSRPRGVTELTFGRPDLGGVRGLVRAEAELAGLGAERSADLVTAASELAANSVAHGGGSGTLWVWKDAMTSSSRSATRA